MLVAEFLFIEALSGEIDSTYIFLTACSTLGFLGVMTGAGSPP
jgi:hypothetical protein